jgi:hypothetical protein
MAKRVESPHLRVRIDPPLLERLEKARKASGRTMTGEIVARLEESFQVPRYIKKAAQDAAAAAADLAYLRMTERGTPLPLRTEEEKK